MSDIIKDKKEAENELNKAFLHFVNRPDVYNFYWFFGYIECMADCGFFDRKTIRNLVIVARKIHTEWRDKNNAI